MANGVFNISKGSIVEKVRDNAANIVVLLLKANEADDTLQDYTTVQAMLQAAGNTEADFTNYARKTAITATINVDNAANTVSLDMPDIEFLNAGGATNNTLTKLVVAYQDSAGDANLTPVAHYDYTETTSGSTLNIAINADGFYRAS